MLTFPDDQRLATLARHCQQDLEPLGLDPVPTDGLHITLARVGKPDAVMPGQLNRLARDAEALLTSAFSVRAMPLAGSRGAVRLSLGPWEPLLRLHHALAKAGAGVGLAPKKPTSAFRPHLSLAYNNRRRRELAPSWRRFQDCALSRPLNSPWPPSSWWSSAVRGGGMLGCTEERPARIAHRCPGREPRPLPCRSRSAGPTTRRPTPP
ncbi:2'-5' RNA ligase family protein [Streptomyces sp. NPDC002265]|uniref:2'-5' RNA ligase family protein n=1 Tax=Streptomyces sp. NPDC002265 TaxID=3154415 RepID=UPI00332551FD